MKKTKATTQERHQQTQPPPHQFLYQPQPTRHTLQSTNWPLLLPKQTVPQEPTSLVQLLKLQFSSVYNEYIYFPNPQNVCPSTTPGTHIPYLIVVVMTLVTFVVVCVTVMTSTVSTICVVVAALWTTATFCVVLPAWVVDVVDVTDVFVRTALGSMVAWLGGARRTEVVWGVCRWWGELRRWGEERR